MSKQKNSKDKIEVLNDELFWLNDKKNSLIQLEIILNKKKNSRTKRTKHTAKEVIKLSNSYQIEFVKIKKFLRELSKEQQLITNKINTVKSQLNEINKPIGAIILQISSETSKLDHVKCNYMVNNAGWKPSYDIRSEGITKNSQLNYKANIYQNTGIGWKDVTLTISTGNPTQDNNRPILSPLYANIYQNQNFGNYNMTNRVNVYNMALTKNEGFTEQSQIIKNQTNVDFNILTKQTINCDGKENLVMLKSYELDTKYIYHSVPKLNKGVFLLAKISNWSQYNLIAGTVSIFFEGNFIGNSQINPEVTSNSLLISMGLDNAVIIERLPIKKIHHFRISKK